MSDTALEIAAVGFGILGMATLAKRLHDDKRERDRQDQEAASNCIRCTGFDKHTGLCASGDSPLRGAVIRDAKAAAAHCRAFKEA